MPTRAEMIPSTTRPTIATGTSERSSARSPSRASSRRRRSTAISCRISAVPRSAIAAQRLERQLRLLDCLRRLGRRSLPCKAHCQEAEDPSDEEDDDCDDEQRKPERKGLGQPRRAGREREADSVEGKCGGACGKTASRYPAQSPSVSPRASPARGSTLRATEAAASRRSPARTRRAHGRSLLPAARFKDRIRSTRISSARRKPPTRSGRRKEEHGSRARAKASRGVRRNVPVHVHGRDGDEQGGRGSAGAAGDRVGPDGDGVRRRSRLRRPFQSRGEHCRVPAREDGGERVRCICGHAVRRCGDRRLRRALRRRP